MKITSREIRSDLTSPRSAHTRTRTDLCISAAAPLHSPTVNHFHDSRRGEITGSQEKWSKHSLQRQEGLSRARSRCNAAISHPRFSSSVSSFALISPSLSLSFSIQWYPLLSLSLSLSNSATPSRSTTRCHKHCVCSHCLLLAPTFLSSSLQPPPCTISLSLSLDFLP